MYEGLYDTRKGLSDDDAKIVGAMTAMLIQSWGRWMYRRVERLSFCDEYTIRRNVSADFTLPYWFHQLRPSESGQARRQLVPLGFLSKGSLVNFSLSDEAGRSLPLLTALQNGQVAASVLRAASDIVLAEETPGPLCCDIGSLVAKAPAEARAIYRELFSKPDTANEARAALGRDANFRELARLFADRFLALTMLPVWPHQRRILHMSYETSLWEPSGILSQAARMSQLSLGYPTIIYIDVPSPSESASHHVEVEAPDQLMITRRESYYFNDDTLTIQRKFIRGGYRRAHFHFANVAPNRRAAVAVNLRPRQSAVIRAALFTSLLATGSLLAVSSSFDFAHTHNGEIVAALLLSFAALVNLFIAREGESEMAGALLFPLRLLASLPVYLCFAAVIAIVVVRDQSEGGTVLWVLSGLGSALVILLTWQWFLIRRSLRRYARKLISEHQDVRLEAH